MIVEAASVDWADIEGAYDDPFVSVVLPEAWDIVVLCLTNGRLALRLTFEIDMLRFRLLSKCPDLFSLNDVCNAKPESFLDCGVRGRGGNADVTGDTASESVLLGRRAVEAVCGLSSADASPNFDCEKAFRIGARLKVLVAAFEPNCVELRLASRARSVDVAIGAKSEGCSDTNIL